MENFKTDDRQKEELGKGLEKMPVKQKSRRSGLDEADKEQASVEIRSWLGAEKDGGEKRNGIKKGRKSLEFGTA